MDGKLSGLTINRDGSQNITITVNSDFSEMYDELKSAPVTVEIKKARKHRSLTANAYAWTLIDQIAERAIDGSFDKIDPISHRIFIRISHAG